MENRSLLVCGGGGGLVCRIAILGFPLRHGPYVHHGPVVPLEVPIAIVPVWGGGTGGRASGDAAKRHPDARGRGEGRGCGAYRGRWAKGQVPTPRRECRARGSCRRRCAPSFQSSVRTVGGVPGGRAAARCPPVPEMSRGMARTVLTFPIVRTSDELQKGGGGVVCEAHVSAGSGRYATSRAPEVRGSASRPRPTRAPVPYQQLALWRVATVRQPCAAENNERRICFMESQ